MVNPPIAFVIFDIILSIRVSSQWHLKIWVYTCKWVFSNKTSCNWQPVQCTNQIIIRSSDIWAFMSFDFKIVRKGPVILTCNEFHQSQPNIKFSMNTLTEFQVKLINSSQRKTQKPWVHRTNWLTEMAIPMFSTNSAVMQGTKHYFTSRRINILYVNNVLLSHKTWNVSTNATDRPMSAFCETRKYLPY